MRLQCLEAGAHGGLPRGPAVNRRQQVEARARCPEQGGIIGVDHGLHQGDSAMAGEGGKARPDDRLAQNMPVLLGQIPARAQPAAPGHDHGCDRRCHVLDPNDGVGSWL